MPNTIRAHANEILELSLTSTDGTVHKVQPLLVDGTVSMSLFNKAIFGSFVLYDGVGVHEFLPIIGEEKFKLVFRSRGRAVKELTGRILGMRDVEFDDTYSAVSYSLDFVSDLGFQSLTGKTVAHYTNASPLEALYDIVDNYFDTEKFVEYSDHQYAKNVEIIYPKVPPFKAIDMILSKTYEGRSNRSSLFFFFEDLDALRFENIESLMSQTQIPNYFFDVFETETSGTRDKEFYRIIDYNYKQKFNTQDAINNGIVDSELIRFDPITKQVLVTETKFRNVSEDLTPFDSSTFRKKNTADFLQSLETKNEPDIGRTMTKSYKVLSSFDSFVYKSMAYGKSIAMYESILQTQLEITVPGHTGRRPGDVINISTFPNGTSYNDRSNRDRYLSGKFLVLGVRHVFNQGEITTILDLSKPSFANRIESVQI